MQQFLKETNAQTIKEIFYKFLTFSFMLKNNARAFLKPIDFKKCQE
jgi:hypothetical protein